MQKDGNSLAYRSKFMKVYSPIEFLRFLKCVKAYKSIDQNATSQRLCSYCVLLALLAYFACTFFLKKYLHSRYYMIRCFKVNSKILNCIQSLCKKNSSKCGHAKQYKAKKIQKWCCILKCCKKISNFFIPVIFCYRLLIFISVNTQKLIFLTFPNVSKSQYFFSI